MDAFDIGGIGPHSPSLATFRRLARCREVTKYSLPIVLQIGVKGRRRGRLGRRELLAHALRYCVFSLSNLHLGHGQIALEGAQRGRRVYSEYGLRHILLRGPEGLSVGVQ